MSPRIPTQGEVTAALQRAADPEQAQFLRRFFKTGPGEYAEGDRFRGIRVPVLRKMASEFRSLPLADTMSLLRSRHHEDRLLALLLLIQRYRAGDPDERAQIYREYLHHTRHINNWDLVDASAHHIVGEHLLGRDKSVLYELTRSKLLWDRRIAVVATYRFIRAGDFGVTLDLAALLLEDREDLIHKATGWMLREVGKRDRAIHQAFLNARYREMPRTMLRYAIEKLPEDTRQAYLKGRI